MNSQQFSSFSASSVFISMEERIAVEGFRMNVHSFNQFYVPQRRRSFRVEIKEQSNPQTHLPISMSEAADVLIEMANSVPNVEPQQINKTHKRKNPPRTNTAIKKQRRKKKVEQSEYPSIPEMPTTMRDRIEEMGGYEINLVIQKQLTDTDLNKNEGRLSMPKKKLAFDFTTEEERNLLSQQENKNKKGINVMIMNNMVEDIRSICLKKWKIGSGNGDVYCLMTQWNAFVEETGLKSGQHIQLWCFRKDYEFEPPRLCFAVVRLN